MADIAQLVEHVESYPVLDTNSTYLGNVVVVGSNPAIRHNQNNHWPQPWPVLRTKCSAHMVTKVN